MSTTEDFTLELPVESSRAAQTDAKGNPFKIQGRLLNVLRDKLLAAVKLPSRDDVLLAAEVAFDKYVAPIDIPFVPNVVEPMVDEAMKKVFLDTVGRAYDAIAKSKQAA